MVPHIIHDIDDFLSLPPEVLSIVDRFHAPLTPDLANVAREALSVGSFEIYQEALKSPLLSLDVDNTRWTKEIPVTHLIDTILIFAKTLRVASSPGHIHRFGSRPTYGTWASFITTLGFASSEDAFVISDTQFLLPRTVGSTQAEPTIFEGNASLLIAWAILPKERAQAKIEVEDTLENEQQEKPEDEVMDVLENESQCGSNPKELVTMEDDESDSESVENITADKMEVDHEVDDSSLVDVEEDYHVDEIVDYDDESGEELQVEEPGNGLVPNGDGPKSHNLESSDSEDSQNNYIDVEAPDDGHILPGTGRRINCVLPSLCIANKDNIRQLVTSVVYQRYTWGIFLPTIGIEMEGDGTTARIVIGWVDEKNLQTVEQLPYVHLAFSSNIQTPHPSRGVYDLLDPASTLLFAQFVLWTEQHLSRIGQLVNNAVPRDFCWRLDHRRFDTSTANPHDNIASQNYVETWRSCAASELPEHILPLNDDHTNSMSEQSQQQTTRSQTKSQGTGVVDPTEQKSAPSQKRSDQSSVPGSNPTKPGSISKNTTGAGSTKYAGSDRLAPPEPAKKGSSAAGSAKKSTGTAASVFATLEPPNAIANAKPGTELWLWDRLTIRVSRIPFTLIQDDSTREINVKIAAYDNIMKMVIPRLWKELDNMPKCDKLAIGSRQRLHEELNDYSTKHPTVVKDNELESALQCFAHQPTVLYNAIKEARKYHQQEKSRINVPEAEKRRVWDNLLHAYASSHDVLQSSSPDNPPSPSYHHEKTVRCPKNDRVENPSLHSPYAQALLQSTLASFQVPEAVVHSLSNDIRSLLENALASSGGLRDFFASNAAEAPHERDEPSTGRADGVLVIVVPPINPSSATEPALTVSVRGTIIQLYETDTYHKDPKASHRKPELPRTHDHCLMCPAVTEHLDSGTRTCSQVNPMPRIPNALLCVPFFFVENKKDGKTVLQAFNQCRIYCISGVNFLAALGIISVPVYGLVTTGMQGTIMVAWKSRELAPAGVVDAKDKCDFTILVDSHLVSFDLTIPLEVYRFMLAVHRIYLYGLELQTKIKELDLEDILKRPGFSDWAMLPKSKEVPQDTVDTPVVKR